MEKRTIVNGELYHAQHKYLKREWKNGRWQYTYDIKGAVNNVKKKVKDRLGDGKRRTADVAALRLNSTKKVLDYSRRNDDTSVGRNGRSAKGVASAAFYKHVEKQKLINQNQAEQEYSKAKKNAKSAVEAYSKTPISKLRSAPEKVKKTVNNVIDKMFKKKNKKQKSSVNKDLRSRSEDRSQENRAKSTIQQERKKKKYKNWAADRNGGPNDRVRTKEYKK